MEQEFGVMLKQLSKNFYLITKMSAITLPGCCLLDYNRKRGNIVISVQSSITPLPSPSSSTSTLFFFVLSSDLTSLSICLEEEWRGGVDH